MLSIAVKFILLSSDIVRDGDDEEDGTEEEDSNKSPKDNNTLNDPGVQAAITAGEPLLANSYGAKGLGAFQQGQLAQANQQVNVASYLQQQQNAHGQQNLFPLNGPMTQTHPFGPYKNTMETDKIKALEARIVKETVHNNVISRAIEKYRTEISELNQKLVKKTKDLQILNKQCIKYEKKLDKLTKDKKNVKTSKSKRK